MNPQTRIPPPAPVLQPFTQPQYGRDADPTPAHPQFDADIPPLEAHTDPEPQPHNSKDALPPELLQFAQRLRHMDGETLLLLSLLWLLYRENADKKLLLALAYIVF